VAYVLATNGDWSRVLEVVKRANEWADVRVAAAKVPQQRDLVHVPVLAQHLAHEWRDVVRRGSRCHCGSRRHDGEALDGMRCAARGHRQRDERYREGTHDSGCGALMQRVSRCLSSILYAGVELPGSGTATTSSVALVHATASDSQISLRADGLRCLL
jgi:hypothetical protein